MSQHPIWETCIVVVSWFVLSIAIATITKWTFLFGQICYARTSDLEDLTCQKFKFPVALTVIHMFFSWVFCGLYLQLRERLQSAKAASTMWPLSKQIKKVAPLAVCFATSVAMGNLSLKYIYPSFSQMLGGMTPLITVAIAVFVMGKRFNQWTWISMPVICGGLAVCSAGEMNFHVLGCFYAAGAAVLRSVKTLIQGKLLDNQEDKVDSVTLLYFMAPWAGGFLFVASLALEGGDPILIFFPTNELGLAVPASGIPQLVALLAMGGLNACILNIANFLVTSYTSPVTLQVMGNVKNCISIGFSILVLGNDFTAMQGIGVAVCLTGVWIYNSRGGSIGDAAAKAPASEPNRIELPATTDDASESPLPTVVGVPTPKHLLETEARDEPADR